MYGPNVIDVTVKSYWRLFLEEVRFFSYFTLIMQWNMKCPLIDMSFFFGVCVCVWGGEGRVWRVCREGDWRRRLRFLYGHHFAIEGSPGDTYIFIIGFQPVFPKLIEVNFFIKNRRAHVGRILLSFFFNYLFPKHVKAVSFLELCLFGEFGVKYGRISIELKYTLEWI